MQASRTLTGLAAVAAFAAVCNSQQPQAGSPQGRKPKAVTTPVEAPANPGAKKPATTDPKSGHLVLILEGNVLQLRVTHAVAKPSAWSGPVKGLESDFQCVILDKENRELRRVAIDLSPFETDPKKVNRPVVVKGCQVKSPNIGVLLNVPRIPDAARYELRHGKKVIGKATAAALATLLRSAR